MIELILRSMLARRANLTGSFLAVLIVVAAIYPAVILMSASAGGPPTSQRYGAADLIVSIDPEATFGFDESLLGATPRLDLKMVDVVAGIGGVARAAGDVDFYAQLLDRDGNPLTPDDVAQPRGMPWDAAAFAPFTLVTGDAPKHDGQVVIDQALAHAGDYAPGDQVLVLSGEAPSTYTISGIATLEGAPGMDRQATTFFTRAAAHRLANQPDAVDRIAVTLDEDADPAEVIAAIKSSVPGPISVLQGRDIVQVDPSSGWMLYSDFVALLGVLAGFVGFVAIFVIAATFGFSIQQRAREIGLQRAIGLTPWQVRRSIALEALVVTLLASIAGIVIGSSLIPLYVRLAVRRELIPDGFEAGFWFWALPIVIGGAIGISQLAVWGAARRASKIRPIEALRESSVPPKLIGFWRLLMGVSFVAGAGALFALAPSLALDEAVALSMGVAVLLLLGASMLGPLLVIPFSAVMGWLLARISGITGDLARWNARSMPRRMSSVFSPLMLSIGFATLMVAFVATTETATVDESRSRMIADVVVVPGNEGLPLDLAADIAALPGISAVNSHVAITLFSISGEGDDVMINEFEAAAIEPASLPATLDLGFVVGDAADLESGHVLLSEYAAHVFNARVGEEISLRHRDLTEVTVTVAGIYRNELGFGDLVVPIPDLGSHAGTALADAIYISLDQDADPAAARSAIETLRGGGYQFELISGDQHSEAIEQSMIDGAWVTYLIIGSAAALAGLSVVNTLAMSIGERRREFAQLRLVGTTRRQVLAMAGGEGMIIVLIGSVTGVAIGVLSVLGVSIGLTGNAGALTVPLLPVASVLAAGLIVTLGAQLVPTMFVLRSSPIVEASIRE